MTGFSLRAPKKKSKMLRGFSAFAAFSWEYILGWRAAFRLSYLLLFINPLLNLPLVLFLLKHRKKKSGGKKRKMTTWCSCMSSLAEWLVPHWPLTFIMDSAQKYEALDLEALTLKVSISGSVVDHTQSLKDYLLMMLCVIEVMAVYTHVHKECVQSLQKTN